MTAYEHFTERSEFCEERCREAGDSYMKEFWSKTADIYRMARDSMTVAQACAAEWRPAYEYL